MMSLSMMFSGGRPGFCLARDENLSEKQQFRRSQVMGGYNTVKNNYKSNNLSVLSYQTNPRKPVLNSVSHTRCGCRNFKVFGGGGNNEDTRSVLSYQTISTKSNCHLPIISASGGGGNHGGRRIFKVFSGGGNNEEDKSQGIDGDGGANRIRRQRYLLHIISIIPFPAIGVLISLHIHYGSMISPEKGAKAKGLKLHEKKVVSVKKLLADAKTRLESEELDAADYINELEKNLERAKILSNQGRIKGEALSYVVTKMPLLLLMAP